MRRIVCFAFAVATLTAAAFACSSSPAPDAPADPGAPAAAETCGDAGPAPACPTSCSGTPQAECVDGQWECLVPLVDCNFDAGASGNPTSPSVPNCLIDSGYCGSGGYCSIEFLPDASQIVLPAAGDGCKSLPSCDGGGSPSCDCLLANSPSGCTCYSEGPDLTVRCVAFACGQSGCTANAEYCLLDQELDGGPSPVSPVQCLPRPSCDGGETTCACLLAALSESGESCSCALDGDGQPTVTCQANF